jgi:hypothetical protein
MEEILCSGPVADIAALIKACAFPDDSYVLVERFPPRIIPNEERQQLLQFGRLSSGIDPADSISGRVFSQHFELRWQEEDGEYHVVYLGEERHIPQLKKDEETRAKLKRRKDAKTYYLFGEYLNGDKLRNMGLQEEPSYSCYAEVRIPRLLHYPIAGQARRVRLEVCEYVEEETGAVQLFRFQGLEREPEA